MSAPTKRYHYTLEELRAIDADLDEILGKRHPDDVTSVLARVQIALRRQLEQSACYVEGLNQRGTIYSFSDIAKGIRALAASESAPGEAK